MVDVDAIPGLEDLKLGQKITLPLNDQGPQADLHVVERLHSPTLFLRFRVMLYGCEIAEVCAERDHEGAWRVEEL